MRYKALSLAVLLLIMSFVVCAHSGSFHHDRHCNICNVARLQAEPLDSAPAIAPLAVSYDEIVEPATQEPPLPVHPGSPTRAPPLDR